MKTPPPNPADPSRRRFLRSALLAGSAGVLGAPLLVRRLEAMGVFQYPTGIQVVSGDVRRNGALAKEGDPVLAGDRIVTGPDGTVIFVFEQSVYLLRENTELALQAESAGKYKQTAEKIRRLFKGGALMVFNRQDSHRLFTPTAVAGVRGSGAYVEIEPDRTYFCLCYGVSDMAVRGAPDIAETVETTHHESPRYLYGPEAGARIEPAPVIRHTDAELIRLESLVFRRPPFAPAPGPEGGQGATGY